MSSRKILPWPLWGVLLHLCLSIPLWADADQAMERNAHLQQHLGDAFVHFRNAVEEMNRAGEAYVQAELGQTRCDVYAMQCNELVAEDAQLRRQIATLVDQHQQILREQQVFHDRILRLQQSMREVYDDPGSEVAKNLCGDFATSKQCYVQCEEQLIEIVGAYRLKMQRVRELEEQYKSLAGEQKQSALQRDTFLAATREHIRQSLHHYNQGLELLRTYQDGLDALREDVNRWKIDFGWASDIVCFPGNTPVWMENGPREMGPLVDEFDPENPVHVYACDVTGGSCVLRPVTAVYQSCADRLVAIHYGEDHRVEATENHPIYTHHGYLRAREIAERVDNGEVVRIQVVGDQRDLEFVEVHTARVIQRDRPIPVYNLEVAGLQTYFVGSLPLHVHNCSLNRMVQAITNHRQLLCGGAIAVCAGTALGSATLVTGSLAAGPVGAVAGSSVRTLTMGEMRASCTAAVAICSEVLHPLHGDIRDDLVLNKKGSKKEYIGYSDKYKEDYQVKGTTTSLESWYGSEREARAIARTKMGNEPVYLEPGKMRSQDGKWQYRGQLEDLLGHHRNDTPHIHIERIDLNTGIVIKNLHLRWKAK
ncbi:MAG: hypothetical protein OXT67_03605 [Zetaproteobacteria bacterium]|nr:hypothetical protein [Zetaproteobacteria bacterium]